MAGNGDGAAACSDSDAVRGLDLAEQRHARERELLRLCMEKDASPERDEARQGVAVQTVPGDGNCLFTVCMTLPNQTACVDESAYGISGCSGHGACCVLSRGTLVLVHECHWVRVCWRVFRQELG